MNNDSPLLRIENLHAGVGDVEILKGVDLVVERGRIQALMGPNGSGKSTLANVLMGHPGYQITSGRILFDGEDITELPSDDTVLELRLKVMEAMKELGMESSFADRYLNEGFSGGERKRNEVLQMAVLEPVLAIMDETDSGLDIDALKVVAEGIEKLRGPGRGFLIITHYQRLLDYVTPDLVHVFMDGRVVETGGPELAKRLEEEGYDAFRQAVVGS